MTTTARRLVQICAVTGGALLLAPSVAMAVNVTPSPYATTATPSVTVSGIVIKPTTPETPEPTVSGVKIATVTPAPVAGGSALPRTGADVLAWTLTGGVLIVGGIGLVGMARRRSGARH